MTPNPSFLYAPEAIALILKAGEHVAAQREADNDNLPDTDQTERETRQ